MGESRTLNSNRKGSWVEENVLTKSNNGQEHLGIYEKVIQNYLGKVVDHNDETKNIGIIEDAPKLKLEFPKLEYSYDIYNSKKYYTRVQNWQGVVTSIKGGSFKAKLYDLSSGGTNEVAEFDLKEVSPSDKHLLQLGSLFYWSVGSYMENGQMINRSDIRFQRLITLDADDIENIKQSVENKYSRLKERKVDNYSAK